MANISPDSSGAPFISPITTVASVSPAIDPNLVIIPSAAPKGYKKNGMPRLRAPGCCSICKAPDHVKTKCLLYNIDSKSNAIEATPPKRKYQKQKVRKVDMTDDTDIDPFATEEDIPAQKKRKHTKKVKGIDRSDVNSSNDPAATATLASRAQKQKARSTSGTKDGQKTSDLGSSTPLSIPTLPKIGLFNTRLPTLKGWKAPIVADLDATRYVSQKYPKSFKFQNINPALTTSKGIPLHGSPNNDTGSSLLPNAWQPGPGQHAGIMQTACHQQTHSPNCTLLSSNSIMGPGSASPTNNPFRESVCIGCRYEAVPLDLAGGNGSQSYYQGSWLFSSGWSSSTEASLAQQQTLGLPPLDAVISEFYKEQFQSGVATEGYMQYK